MLHPEVDVQITLLTFLRVVLVPSVAIAVLVASTSLLDVRFTEPYVALAIITALLDVARHGARRAAARRTSSARAA